MASSTGVQKVCFNSKCQESLIIPRAGWKCHSGRFAKLCYGCASAYEAKQFCDIYHSDATGWRRCDSCEKQIHCGCIASVGFYVLLDDGGMKCLSCSSRDVSLTPNPAWQPTSCRLVISERNSDFSPRLTTVSYPEPCRQTPNTEPEIDIPDSIGRVLATEPLSATPLGETERMIEESMERIRTWCLRFVQSDTDEDIPVGVEHHGQRNMVVKDKRKVAEIRVRRPTSAPSVVKRKRISNDSGRKSSTEAQARNGKPRRNKPLSCCRPKISDQGLKPIARDSNAKVTPLFEKVLTASDVGKIGRLVLPMKCAESFFPHIDLPEGIPLEIQDSNGKEWILRFRFWPNSNSRMYVLEGVSPCILSMKLQAGDTVTFSRMESDAKFVMGFRRGTIASSSNKQGHITTSTSNGVSVGNIATTSVKRKCCATSLNSNRTEHGNKMHRLALDQSEPPCGSIVPAMENATIVATAPTIFAGSRCSTEEIANIFMEINQECSKKRKPGYPEPEPLEIVADLAIIDVNALPAPPRATKKHPRHRPGCTCIVCIQPPSGNNHKLSGQSGCCPTVTRRPRSLKCRRGHKRYGKDHPLPTRQPEHILRLPEMGSKNLNNKMRVTCGSEDDESEERPSLGG